MISREFSGLTLRLSFAFLLILSVHISYAQTPQHAEEAKQNTSKTMSQPVVCKQEYALCTSAPCIPDPTQPKQAAACKCSVRKGQSVGFKSCEERKAKTLEIGKTKTQEFVVTILFSTYSFDEAPTKPMMICPGGTPWTNCLDKPCAVDPADPLKAICMCEIEPPQNSFITLGGNCNTESCENKYWSGGPINTVNLEEAKKDVIPILSLAKAMQIEAPANYCPADQDWLTKVFNSDR